MKGININCKTVNFIDMILSGEKTIETRRINSLKSLVGQRVGLIETGNGKAKLRGYATISDVIEFCSEYVWDMYRHAHKVPKGSEFDFREKKFGYILKNVVAVSSPIEINTYGIKWREVPEEGEGYEKHEN